MSKHITNRLDFVLQAAYKHAAREYLDRGEPVPTDLIIDVDHVLLAMVQLSTMASEVLNDAGLDLVDTEDAVRARRRPDIGPTTLGQTVRATRARTPERPWLDANDLVATGIKIDLSISEVEVTGADQST